jgi:bla regulator protein blaR1
VEFRNAVVGAPHLYLLNGVIVDICDTNKIDPETIELVSVLEKNSVAAIEKHGEKGKNGVVEVVTKKNISHTSRNKASEDKLVVVEDIPEFPGGKDAMFAWISQHIEYPAEARNKKLEGTIKVRFVINSKGKVGEVVVLKSENPALDAEAIRVVSSMPDWKPGTQSGKAVDVYYMIPVEFRLQ